MSYWGSYWGTEQHQQDIDQLSSELRDLNLKKMVTRDRSEVIEIDRVCDEMESKLAALMNYEGIEFNNGGKQIGRQTKPRYSATTEAALLPLHNLRSSFTEREINAIHRLFEEKYDSQPLDHRDWGRVGNSFGLHRLEVLRLVEREMRNWHIVDTTYYGDDDLLGEIWYRRLPRG